MCKQSFISKIITSLKATVNDYSLRKIQSYGPLDYDEVKTDYYIYRQTLGDYARRAYGKRLAKRLAKRFIGLFTGTYYI
jgi:hypothetical protein